ncbi:pyridoxamine 5'-phosphate oxidase family protein [Arthrobacter agilis]|uniref:pyridoxamine 5'-phosphate oxidase family protein n=1 Tax=Arthrobacter agilis TaxID=37921 RepID=UPI002787DDA9|nr:pyridoxamine 5'-phosphate oxidase family protein [Arthrobacter agilis]MDQ0735090.1 nitroimidazol reductase NimA-like FMN-containing flavoprotein (pyridoxamine 5'-phosphate oxidase superfamily) [Arthrobacter agilis]
MNAEPTPTRILPAHECWALLRATSVGRLALCKDGRPEIFPINFTVDHGTVVYRTSEGTKSLAAEHAPAALEADGSYTDDGTGQEVVWSVVVKGDAATIAVTSELLATVQLPLHPWESGRKDRFMRLVPGSISGRAFPRSGSNNPVNQEASAT